MPEPSPERVRSGTFRIDREEAVRKLGAFQLADPSEFVLCWVRAAVVSGASRVRVEAARDHLQVGFDGPPWPAAELQDPYSAFFEAEGAAAARARHFVTGALGALRLGAREVLAATGPQSGRAGVRVTAAGPAPYQPNSAGPDTILWATFAAGTDEEQWPRERLLGHLRHRCGMLPVPLYLPAGRDGEEAAPDAAVGGPVPGVAFEEDGLRGRLFPPERGAAGASVVNLYVCGVRASSLPWTLRRAQVEAHLDDPGFALDVSQQGVVLDARVQRAIAAVERHAETLLHAALERQEKNYARLTRFLFSGGAARLLAGPDGARHGWLDTLLAFVSGRLEDRDRLLAWETRVADWLRTAAGALGPGAPADPLGARLYRAPLYLATDGRLLSVADLDRLVESFGSLAASAGPSRHVLKTPVLWRPREDDPLLSRRYRGRLKWYSAPEFGQPDNGGR